VTQKRPYRDPATDDELQTAVNAAAACRLIADCKMYGLVDGGPAIDITRCDELLAMGAARGVRPNAPVEEIAIDYIRQWNADHEPEATAAARRPRALSES